MRRRPEHLLTLGVSLGALGALGIALLEGSVDIPATEVARLLFQDDGSIADRIVNQLRLPRALTAFGIGGMLAVAVLAGVGAFWLPPLAFGGALASMLVVFLLAQRGEAPDNRRLLLSGIVMAAGWSALIGLVLSLAPPLQLPGMLFWLMGDLGGAPRPGLALGVLASGLAGALWLAPQLNLAGFGMAQAAALGVDPRRLRSNLFVLSSLLTAGAIGFVGLVTPHLVRLLGATDHRWLLPLSALLGGSLLVLADTLARTLIALAQLPVGVLTALLGVPIFLWLLNREGRS